MDRAITDEILEELSSALQRVEAQSSAVLEFVKGKGIANEEEIAPYLERANEASSVRWRAARVRMAHLFAGLEKTERQALEKTERQAKEQERSREPKDAKDQEQPQGKSAESETAKPAEAQADKPSSATADTGANKQPPSANPTDSPSREEANRKGQALETAQESAGAAKTDESSRPHSKPTHDAVADTNKKGTEPSDQSPSTDSSRKNDGHKAA